MLDHYIQKNILYRLAFADSLKFSELKPDDLDNKLFTYHLKKTLLTGFVEKNSNGSYQLTAEGRRVGKDILQKDSYLINRAYSILYLIVKRQADGAWLLIRRKAQPLLGLNGFMQARPLLDMNATEIAAKTLLDKTNLIGTFEFISSGFFKIYKDDQMESFTNFTLLYCENAVGELEQNDDLSDYYWDLSPNFSDESMLPTVATLAGLVDSRMPFTEQTFRL